MRASITIRTHATRRAEPSRGAARTTAIALALAAFHLASATSPFVAKANAQGLAPAMPSQHDPKDLVRAELVADVEALAPGRPFRLAVRLEMKDGWHVNWLNPGDAGLAPGIEWRVPKGFKTTVMCWPYPERFPTGPLVIFGYAKELFLSTEVTPPSDFTPGTVVDLGAEVTWLACEEACVPGSASLSLKLPAEKTARPSPTWAKRVEEWQRRCPGPAGAWSVDASMGDQATLLLDVQTVEDAGVTLNSAFFYPYEPGIIEHAASQPLSVLPGLRGRAAYQLRVELSRVSPQVRDRVRGVLVLNTGAPQAIEVDVPLRTR
jgi:thiol:disulfide interchange protein DsbD